MLTYLHAPLQLFDNYGSRLVSGAVYTYEIGSTTNKISYKDIYGTSPNTFPVILNHAGRAEIYMNGSYTIRITDKDGVDIDTFDIRGSSQDSLSTSAIGNFAQNEVISVNTYADVRAINSPYAWVFVQGREHQADGAQGLFYLDQSSTSPDDDGIVLDPNTTGRYIRYDVQKVDSRWFGLTYDSIISQSIYLSAACASSLRFAKPVYIDGNVYLNSNFQTSAEVEFSDNSSLVSTLPISASFYSEVIGANDIFGNTVQPIFYANDEVKYSWFYADNVEGRVQKLLKCTSEECLINFDEDIVTTESLIIPSNFTFKSNKNIYFNTSSPMDISISLIEKVNANVFTFKQFSTVGTITIPFEITPEFFSAIGFGADDTIPVQASLRSGNILLTKSMVSSGAHITTEPISIRSENIKKSEMPQLTLSSLAFSTLLLKNIALFASLNGTTLNASNSRIVCDGTVNYVVYNDVEVISGKLLTIDSELENVIYTGTSTPCSKISKLTNSQFTNLLMTGSDKIEGLISNVTITPISANSLIVKDTVISNLYYNDSSDTFKPVLVLSGNNTINNSNFYAKNYKQLVQGNSSSATFNSCTFSDNVTVSEASNVYKLNGCQGGTLEINGKRNSVDYRTKIFTSGIFTDSLDNWGSKLGDDTIDVSLVDDFIKFNQAYTFDTNVYAASTIKPDELSSTYVYYYVPTVSSSFEKFVRFGGRLKVSLKNAGNSYFKICVAEPEYIWSKGGVNVALNTSATSLWTGSNKLLMETGILSNNSTSTITTEFSYNINQHSFRPVVETEGSANYPIQLTDILGRRDITLNSSATTPFYTNCDVYFVGYVDADTEVKIEWIAEIPVNNLISQTYFKNISATPDTYVIALENYGGFDYYSSGVNKLSNKWLVDIDYTEVGNKVLMRGVCPSIIDSVKNISGTSQPLFRNGYALLVDNWKFVRNGFDLNMSNTLSTLLENDVEIVIDTLVDNTISTSASPQKLIKPFSTNRFYKIVENLI